MPMRRVVTAALILLLATGSAGARTLDQVPPYLKKEGNFVSIPAVALGGLGAVVGGIVALPAALVAAPIGWAAGDPLGYTMLPISVLATGGAEAGYHVGGAIPWALKNGFYDAPMAGIAKIKGEPSSGLVAQVDPPPVLPELQYLESTPLDARVPVVQQRQYSAALPPPKELTSLMLKRALSPFKPPPGALPVRAPAQQQAIAPRPPLVAPAAATSTATSATPPPAAVVVPPPPVTPAAPAPVVRAAQPRPTAKAPEPSPEPRTAPVEEQGSRAAEPAMDADDAAPAERPSLRKKKRKFSERFSF